MPRSCALESPLVTRPELICGLCRRHTNSLGVVHFPMNEVVQFPMIIDTSAAPNPIFHQPFSQWRPC